MKNTIVIVGMLMLATEAKAQIGIGTIVPDNSSMLDIRSTTKGLLIPRMDSNARIAIAAPAKGLMVYDSSYKQLYFHNGAAWGRVDGATVSGVSSVGGGSLSPLFTTSVANPTTSPVISFSLTNAAAQTVLTNATAGAAAPAYGKVVPQALQNTGGTATAATLYHGDATWSAVDLASEVTGNLATSHLNSGTGASSTTFWNGSGAWMAPFSLTTTGSGAATFTGGVLNIPVAGSSSGTVSSVASGSLSPVFTSSVANASTTPSISYSLTNAPAQTVLTNGTALAAAPAYGKVVPQALQNAGGTASATTVYHGDATWSAVDLATEVTGNLPVTNLNGGTGAGPNTFWQGNGTWSAIDISSADITGNLAIAHLNGGTGAGANTFWQGNGTWAAIDLSTADVTGNLPVSRLNSGTSASASTFWNGSGTWTAPFTLTTAGSGAATFSGGVLNIPTPVASGTTLPAQTGNAGKFLTTDGTNTSWATAGPGLYDAANIKLGTILDISNSYVQIVTSTGHIVRVLFQQDGTNDFPTDQIYWTAAGCSGTPYLNDGGSANSVRYSKILAYSDAQNQLYAMASPNAAGVSISVSFTSATIENPTCMTDVGSRDGWALTAVSRATVGLPASFTRPLVIK